VIARHDRAVKPRIVHRTQKSFANAFRGSADGYSGSVGIEGDNSLRGGDIARHGFQCDFDCVWSVPWIERRVVYYKGWKDARARDNKEQDEGDH
jgi:hypothetical protein